MAIQFQEYLRAMPHGSDCIILINLSGLRPGIGEHMIFMLPMVILFMDVSLITSPDW